MLMGMKTIGVLTLNKRRIMKILGILVAAIGAFLTIVGALCARYGILVGLVLCILQATAVIAIGWTVVIWSTVGLILGGLLSLVIGSGVAILGVYLADNK